MKKGFGKKEDLEKTEDGGRMSSADPSAVSDRALQRGFSQLGSLGSGNHFLEIQYISKIFQGDIAKTFGLLEEEFAYPFLYEIFNIGEINRMHLTCGVLNSPSD